MGQQHLFPKQKLLVQTPVIVTSMWSSPAFMHYGTMRLLILNFPNSARILKYATFGILMFSLFCLLQLFQYKGDKDKPSRVIPQNNVHYKHSICVGFLGRLGNQIFQFASAYGIAKQKGMHLRISASDSVAEIFNITDVVKVNNKQHCSHAVFKYERYSCAYDASLLDFSPKTDVLLLEYLQSWKYFVNVTEDLRKQLTFREDIANVAKDIFLKNIKSSKYYNNNATYVGIHVRRGDMVTESDGKEKPTLYNVAPRGYIISAMSYFLRSYKHVTFVICSDDINWVKKQIGKYTKLLNMVLIEKNVPEIDLAILSFCNHTIMTTGTFSWWGAWLTGGVAVYYKHYILETSLLRKQFSEDFSDYFMPHWIPME